MQYENLTWDTAVRWYMIRKYPNIRTLFMGINPVITFKMVWAELVVGHDVGRVLGVGIAPSAVGDVIAQAGELAGVDVEAVISLYDAAENIAKAGISVAV